MRIRVGFDDWPPSAAGAESPVKTADFISLAGRSQSLNTPERPRPDQPPPRRTPHLRTPAPPHARARTRFTRALYFLH
jgi:hypothetical protein